MAIESIKEASWFSSIWRPTQKNLVLEPEKPLIGILSFEVSKLMLKVANLWKCLSDTRMSRLRQELNNSLGIRKLVSEDQDYLMDLALAEIFENLMYVANAVARLGKKCADPIYHNLEHVFYNPMELDLNWYGWEYRLKKMERRVKKMERFAAVTSQLNEELEVLFELENCLRRMQANNVNQFKLHEFQQKVLWQREEVSGLREMSPWVRTYDYIVRLLLRSLLTIVARIKFVFGLTREKGFLEVPDNGCFARSNSISGVTQTSVYPSESSFRRSASNLGHSQNKLQTCYQPPIFCGKYQQQPLKPRRLARVGPFMGCMTTRVDSPVWETSSSPEYDGTITKPYIVQPKTAVGGTLFSFKRKPVNTQQSTLGNAALSLHYANIIILIEQLAISPHFISFEAREDLYNMLTTSIKNSFKRKLSLFSKSSVYNSGFASDWQSSIGKTLDWLAPLAHNMMKWHAERSFEKQTMEPGGNVLLVQTLYYADQAMSEDAIAELLMGLHYISRFGREINHKAFIGSPCGVASDDYSLHKGKASSITLHD